MSLAINSESKSSEYNYSWAFRLSISSRRETIQMVGGASAVVAAVLAQRNESRHLLSSVKHPQQLTTKFTLADLHHEFPTVGAGAAVLRRWWWQCRGGGCIGAVVGRMTTSRVDDCVGEDGVGRGNLGPRGSGGRAMPKSRKWRRWVARGCGTWRGAMGLYRMGGVQDLRKEARGCMGDGEGSTGGRELDLEEDGWENGCTARLARVSGDGEGFTASAGTINHSAGHHAMSVEG